MAKNEVQNLTKEENNTVIQKNDTIYEVDESDIVTKLPPSTSCVTSEQQMSHLKFPVNFSSLKKSLVSYDKLRLLHIKMSYIHRPM